MREFFLDLDKEIREMFSLVENSSWWGSLALMSTKRFLIELDNILFHQLQHRQLTGEGEDTPSARWCAEGTFLKRPGRNRTRLQQGQNRIPREVRGGDQCRGPFCRPDPHVCLMGHTDPHLCTGPHAPSLSLLLSM